MIHFSQVDYQSALLQFEKEEKAGRRYRLGELNTSLWLRKNNINLDDVKQLAAELPDPRLVIIGEGSFSGFYIYSNKMQVCYKNGLVFQNAGTVS